jgi:hypothetical protein
MQNVIDGMTDESLDELTLCLCGEEFQESVDVILKELANRKKNKKL